MTIEHRNYSSRVWVAGNAAAVTEGVMQAAASGVTAAAAINADLTAEDTAAAGRSGCPPSPTSANGGWNWPRKRCGRTSAVTRRSRR